MIFVKWSQSRDFPILKTRHYQKEKNKNIQEWGDVCVPEELGCWIRLET
jgi:hypothetical protein